VTKTVKNLDGVFMASPKSPLPTRTLYIGGWGLGWDFGWVKVGLKTLCRWLGPWMGFWLGESGFKDSVEQVAGTLDGLLAG
jgi:hypothetical protein